MKLNEMIELFSKFHLQLHGTSIHSNIKKLLYFEA